MADQTQSENARRLIERLDAEARAECTAILDEAQARARDIVETARATARRKVRADIQELRRNGAQEISRIQSHFETERRQLRQKRGLAAQERGLSRLCGALEQLWQDKASRATWCANLLEEARIQLLHPDWTIEHPHDWPTGELADFLTRVEAITGRAPASRAGDHASGLIIRSDTARIDGTGPTLCRDTGRLRALFQSQLETMESEDRP